MVRISEPRRTHQAVLSLPFGLDKPTESFRVYAMTGDARYIRQIPPAPFLSRIRLSGSPIKKLLPPFASVWIALLVGAITSAAQEQLFSNYNCAITPPPGWRTTTNATSASGTFTVTFTAPGRTRFLLLIVQNERKTSEPLDDFYIASYERSVQLRGGGKPLSTRSMEIDGIKAYERVANVVIKGKNASTIRHLILTDTGVYTVEGMRFNGPVLEAPEIQEALNSFHFISQPQAPVLSPERAAFRIGYMIGRYGPFVVFGVGAIVLGIFLLIRKRRRRGSVPPPLPSQL